MTAVLFIDLDDFKVVNDSLGHAAGDALLVAVTERIAGSVRDGDLVARLGGDEFAVLTADAADLKRSIAMAQRLVRELRAPYLIGDRHVSVTASIGIASARDATELASDVVRNADVAMYMAKANGKAGFAIFDPGMHAAIRERHELGTQLQVAAELGQLRLVYQPIVSLRTGKPAGVEALVRWEHPERGLVAPLEFIELAEENGAILPIGRWVLNEACHAFAEWGLGRPDLFLCVNVSAREIQQPDFVLAVEATLRDAGLPAERLSLEITETALLKATPTHDRDARIAPAPRRAGRDRRLRDGLLLAQPPPPVPGRRAEDRERVRPGARLRLAVGGTRRRDRRDERLAPDHDRRRGHRGRRPGRADARSRLHVRPGLLLLAAGQRRGRREARSARRRRRKRGRLDGDGACGALPAARYHQWTPARPDPVGEERGRAAASSGVGR